MGFMGQKKFGDDRKYFWFQVHLQWANNSRCVEIC